MSDSVEDRAAAKPPKRGEAAWKEEMDAVGERNDRARKEGRQLRQADERRAAERRRAAELREVAELRGTWNSTRLP